MKQNSLRSGFTLVELLVVIAIIALLSGLSAVAYGGFVRSAKKKQSQAIVNTLVAAIEQYHAEYGSFPPPVRTQTGAAFTFNTDSADMTILLGELTGDNATINYKDKNFLPLDDAKGGNNGITRNAGGVAETLVDPVGKPYTLIFNSNYDANGIAIPSEYLRGTQTATDTVQAKVIIFNKGIMSASEESDATAKDHVISWN